MQKTKNLILLAVVMMTALCASTAKADHLIFTQVAHHNASGVRDDNYKPAAIAIDRPKINLHLDIYGNGKLNYSEGFLSDEYSYDITWTGGNSDNSKTYKTTGRDNSGIIISPDSKILIEFGSDGRSFDVYAFNTEPGKFGQKDDEAWFGKWLESNYGVKFKVDYKYTDSYKQLIKGFDQLHKYAADGNVKDAPRLVEELLKHLNQLNSDPDFMKEFEREHKEQLQKDLETLVYEQAMQNWWDLLNEIFK